MSLLDLHAHRPSHRPRPPWRGRTTASRRHGRCSTPARTMNDAADRPMHVGRRRGDDGAHPEPGHATGHPTSSRPRRRSARRTRSAQRCQPTGWSTHDASVIGGDLPRRREGDPQVDRRHRQRCGARRSRLARVRTYLREKGELPEESLVAMCTDLGAVRRRRRAPWQPGVVDGGRRRQRHRRPHRAVAGGARVDASVQEFSSAVGARTLTEYSQFIPGGLALLAARTTSRFEMANRVDPTANCVVTNVPGPREAALLRRRQAGHDVRDGSDRRRPRAHAPGHQLRDEVRHRCHIVSKDAPLPRSTRNACRTPTTNWPRPPPPEHRPRSVVPEPARPPNRPRAHRVGNLAHGRRLTDRNPRHRRWRALAVRLSERLFGWQPASVWFRSVRPVYDRPGHRPGRLRGGATTSTTGQTGVTDP